jgi:phosphoribosylformylglycinamidine synthase PurS subunit
MKVRILVRLKSGVLDVQGKAVEQGLHRLGLDAIDRVRVGRLIEFDVPTSSRSEADALAKKACEELLANTIIENYEIQAAE